MDVDLEETVAPKASPIITESGSAHHGADHPIAEDKLRRSLSPRQVQMIAIGGTIG